MLKSLNMLKKKLRKYFTLIKFRMLLRPIKICGRLNNVTGNYKNNNVNIYIILGADGLTKNDYFEIVNK